MITRNNITNKRVAELSATLQPITEALTFLQVSEIIGMAEDYISYNSPYYCNGLQRVDFGSTFSSCIFEKVEEYQVLRFFATEVYNSGEGMYNYYLNEMEHENEDDFMDYGDYEDQLEKKGCTEYKQVWIDRKGKTETIILDEDAVYDEQVFCSVHSKHEWLNSPKIMPILLTNINEYDDYAYTYADDEDIILKDIKKSFIESLRKYNARFIDEIKDHGFVDEFIHFYRTFKVLSKHHIALPRGFEDMRIYFDSLKKMEGRGVCLTEPMLVNPATIIAEYNREREIRERERIERQKQEAIKAEESFDVNHSYLFGIEFDTDEFHFKSLDSVEEYRREGEIMHHCIYNCGYYKKHEVLSMHITDHEGNRVATCSVNVVEGTIVQLQTMCNEPTWRQGDEYKEIWKTLMARMHTFPKPQIKQNKQLKIA